MPSSVEEVCPTKDAVLVLLDFLVDPLLPSKSYSSKEPPSPSQEELVAKQVHAVVLLYNYYHRKRHPELEFLEFESFCKMALVLKPSLLSYLKLMQRAGCTEVDDLDKQPSLTEKSISDSCDICRSLDVSNNYPVIDDWPITKVAVFLVDSKKENCFLFHGSITQGVWSLIEKDVNDPNQTSEAMTEEKPGNKKKRVVKRTPKANHAANEASHQQIAWLAVKEACGISQGDLRTLENHVVYSVGKAKTAVRLYIMQCTQTNQDMNLVPINDAMESLRGPLVMKEFGSWITTPVVEYFHLLPFSDKVKEWLSREGLLSIPEIVQEHGNCNNSLKVEPLLDISDSLEAVRDCENLDCFQTKVELQPNTSNSSGGVEEVQSHNNFHSVVKPLPDSSDHFETVKGGDHISCLEVKSPLNSAHHTKIVQDIENLDSCQKKVESLPNTSVTFEGVEEVLSHNNCDLELKPQPNSLDHFEIVKEVENQDISQVKVEPLSDALQFLEVVKEVDSDATSSLEMKPLPNNLNHFEEAKEVEDHSCSPLKVDTVPTNSGNEVIKDVENYESSPLKVFTVPNTSQNEDIKDVENFNSLPLKVDTMPKSSQNDSLKDVENCSSSHIKVEPQQEDEHCNSSHLELEPLTNTSHHSEAVDLVENNSSPLKEGKVLDTSQPSAEVREVSIGYCNHEKEEPQQYSQHSAAEEEVKYGYRKVETEPVVYRKRNRSQKICNSKDSGHKTSVYTTTDHRTQVEMCAVTGPSNNMDIDDLIMDCKPTKILPPEDPSDKQKQLILAEQTDQAAPSGGAIVLGEGTDSISNFLQHSDKKIFSDNKVSDAAMSDQAENKDHALVCVNSEIEHLRKIQHTIASKEDLLSKTALQVLYKKREMLSHKHRSISDELALCDRSIQTILDGGENDLAVKIDTIIEGCGNRCLRSFTTVEHKGGLHFFDEDSLSVVKRRKLSDADLFVHSPCQELDGICHENSWILPTYCVHVSEGGFQASVTVKGVDFECSTEGTVCDTPREARNSAASNMLVKIRSMASKS